MKQLGNASQLRVLLPILAGAFAVVNSPAQERSLNSAYGYYYPPSPPPGTSAPVQRQTSIPPAAVQQPPYAYPSMQGASPAPKAPTDIEALRRENEALRRQLAGEAPAAPARPQTQPMPKTAQQTEPYKVRQGDSLWGLAIRHRTRVALLRELNGLTSDRIVQGQILQLPVRAAKPASAPQQYAQAPAPVPAPKPQPIVTGPSAPYVVKRGESLGVIAKRFNVSQGSIQAANQLSSPNKIYAGQMLQIPGRTTADIASAQAPQTKTKAVSTSQPRFVSTKNQPDEPSVVYYQPAQVDAITSYRIQPGDTLDSIAARRGVSKESILRYNGLPGNQLPAPGGELILPVSRTVSM